MSRPFVASDMPPRRSRPLVLMYAVNFGKGFGGGELTGEEFANEFLEQGCDVLYAYNRKHSDSKTELSDGITAKKVDRGKLIDLAKEIKPDFMFSRGSGVAEESAFVAQQLHVPSGYYIQFWRDFVFQHPDDNQPMLEGGEKCVFQFNELNRLGKPNTEDLDYKGARAVADHNVVIANSWFSYHVIRRTTGRKPLVAFPSYLPEHISKSPKPYTEREYTVLSSLQNLKGSARFLELARRFPKEKFLILTTKFHSKWSEEMTREADAIPNVELRPWTDDMAEIYDNAKCMFIGTLTAETFSRVALEARLSGVPCLVTDNGNLPNIVLNVPVGQDWHECVRDGRVRDWGRSSVEGIDRIHEKSEVIYGDGGVVCPQGAEMGAFVEALQFILDGKVKHSKVTEYDKTNRDKVVKNMIEMIPLRRILLVAGGGPGVQTMCRNLAQISGAGYVTARSAEYVNTADYDLFVISGTMKSPFANKVMQACPGRVVASWNSHFSQMAFSPHEMEEWLRLFKMVKDGKLAGMVTSYEDDASTYQTLAAMPEGEPQDERFQWMCNTGSSELTFPPHQEYPPDFKEGGFTVGVLGPAAERKNIITGLAGAVIAKAPMRLSSWLLRDKLIDTFLIAAWADFAAFNLDGPERVRAMVQDCGCMLHLSHSETFSYASIEALLLGVPVIGNQYTPAHAFRRKHELLQRYLWVDVNSPDAVAQKICELRDLSVEDYTEIKRMCREHALDLLERHADGALGILWFFLDRAKAAEAVPSLGPGRLAMPNDPVTFLPGPNPPRVRRRGIRSEKPPTDHPASKRGRARYKP